MIINPWKRIDPTTVAKIGYRTTVVKTFEMPDGTVRPYATVGAESERAGGVIALTTDCKVIVCKQFRPGPEKIMMEIPGGAIELDEDPQAGAIRELQEESGYTSKNVKLLGTYSGNAYSSAHWFYYIAYDCVPTRRGQQTDDTEFINVELLSITEFLKLAKNDMITDVAAVLMAYDELRIIEESNHAESH